MTFMMISLQTTNLLSIFRHLLIVIPIPIVLLVPGLRQLTHKSPRPPSIHSVLGYELIQAWGCVYAFKIAFSSSRLSPRRSGPSLFSPHAGNRHCLQHPSPTCGVPQMGHYQPTRATLPSLLL